MGLSIKGASNAARAAASEFIRLHVATLKAIYSASTYIATTMKQMYTDGVMATVKNKLTLAKLKSAAASYAESSAVLSYAYSAITASGASLSLAASLTVLTGGMFALVAAVGALAVGIITNFDKIKGSVSGAVSGVMPILGALKDILLTVFVETWNIIVATISSLKTAFLPLISIVMDFIGIFTTLFGMNKDAEQSFLSLSSVVNVIVGALQFVSDAIQAVIGVIGFLGNIIGTIIRIHLFPITVSLQLLAAGFRAVYEAGKNFIDNILRSTTGSGLAKNIERVIDVINDLREGFDKIPDKIEDVVNSVIDKINGFITKINNAIPYFELRTIDRIEVTGGGLETDRDELATDTAGAKGSLSRVVSNTINMKTENNQTVNQTVNADPEDKSTVSRVVEDAIERANRFERGRAASQ